MICMHKPNEDACPVYKQVIDICSSSLLVNGCRCDNLSFFRIKQFHRIPKKEKATRLDCPILCLLHLTGSVGLVSTMAQFLPSRWNQLIIFTDSRITLEIVLFWLKAIRVNLFFSVSVTLTTILSVLVWVAFLLYLDIVQI